MFKPSRILVPTDMSEHSDKAIRHAFDIARQFDSEVFLLHVIQDPVQQCTADFCLDEELFNKLQTQMCESVRSAILKQLEKFPYMDPDKVTTDIKIGTPYAQILKEAEERGVDLIVISSLGSSGLAKYLIGSVSRHVLLGAKCPVLLTK
jgi:nucleotide-binding universal stress UspA family protein